MDFKLAMNRAAFQLKKNSPQLLIVGGIAAFAGTCFFVGKGTLKAQEVIKKHKEGVSTIHECKETIDESEYTEQDYKQDLTKQYVQTGVEMVRAYAPEIGCAALSLGCFIGSNKILNKRNLALSAAYATLDRGYKAAKNRLIEEFGAEKATQLLNGIKPVEIEEAVTDEKGKTKTVKKTVNRVDNAKDMSPYAEFFAEYKVGGERNPYWNRDNTINLCTLRGVQSYANDLLKAQGYLYLSDVLKLLGLDETKASRVVGWIYDKNKPSGDNYINFNLPTVFDAKGEECILVDFNVDGNIWELMDNVDYQQH